MVLAGGPFGLGPLELGLILVVLVMLFGATRLADIGGSLGKGIREFRKNVKDDEDLPVIGGAATMASASDTVAAIKCPSCGTLNPLNSRHCNNCGSALATPAT